MGWEELNGDRPELKPRSDEAKRLAGAFAALFGSELGQYVLEALRAHTIEKPVMVQRAFDGHAMGMLMAFREGENNLYRWIVSEIKKGQEHV